MSFKKQGVDYVTTRLPLQDFEAIRALRQAGFVQLDEIFRYEKDLSQVSPPFTEAGFREATRHDAQVIGNLAAQTFKFSRFHRDPLVAPAQAQNVHLEWAKNSALGLAADVVLIAEQGGQIAGFSTVKLNGKTATIVLVCVADSHSGKGLAGKLTAMACSWMKSKGVGTAFVQTQADNARANAVYLGQGFKIAEKFVTLRWASGDNAGRIADLAPGAFLSIQSGFLAEMKEISDALGGDIQKIWEATAADRRVGSTFNPLHDPDMAANFQDAESLWRLAQKQHFDFKLLRCAVEHNQSENWIQRIKKIFSRLRF